jgi:hypothetical protein
MIYAGILGYLLVLGLFFYEEIFSANAMKITGSKNLFFNEHPAYLLWLTILFLQGPLWGLLVFPATSAIKEIKRDLGSEYRIWKDVLALFAAFLILVIAARLTIYRYLELPVSLIQNHAIKLPVFTFIDQGVAAYFLAGIVLAGKNCARSYNMGDFKIIKYNRMRSYQNLFLSFTGLILSFGVIATILFRNVVLADHPNIPGSFPPEFVVAFGLFNSMAILIFYLPNYIILLKYGRKVVENNFPIEIEGAENINANIEKQNNLSKELKLDITIAKSIRQILLIISPLLSSLIPNVIDLFGKL